MIRFWNDPRWKAALVATLMFGLGAVAGAVADRAWLRTPPRRLVPVPLTAQGMALALDLSATERVRVEAVLDTLRPVVARAAFQGGDSLRWAARVAQQRIEAALPPDRRPQFEDWMTDHHRQMMEHMGGPGGMMGPRGMMGPGTPGGMMGRPMMP